MKIRFSFSIDEEIAGEIERIAMKKGTSRSEVVEKYITRGLAKEPELTSLERIGHQDQVMNLALDSILSMYSLSVKGDLTRKIDLICMILHHSSDNLPLRDRNGVGLCALFEVLNDLKDYDLSRFEEIISKMKRFKKIRQTYLDSYPIWASLPKNFSSEEEIVGEYNNTINNTIDK